MRNQKVLNNNQIQWYDEGSSTRLNYQMIFNELEKEEPKKKETNYSDSQELTRMLDERDARWKNKVEQTREKAYNEGYEKGKEEALEQARSEIDAKLAGIKEIMMEGQQRWAEHQRMLEPGLMDMVFEICESIMGIPVENPEVRKTMNEKLGSLLQKVDEHTKPMLLVSNEDYEYVGEIVEEFAPNTTIFVRKEPGLNPGEFKLETNEEIVVHTFREMLDDFKKSLTLPSWN